jgi:hypothetical protein
MSRRWQRGLDRHQAGFIHPWTLHFWSVSWWCIRFRFRIAEQGRAPWMASWVSSGRWGGGGVGGWRIMEPGNTGMLALASWKIRVKRFMHATCELTGAGRASSHPNSLGRPFDCWQGGRGDGIWAILLVVWRPWEFDEVIGFSCMLPKSNHMYTQLEHNYWTCCISSIYMLPRSNHMNTVGVLQMSVDKTTR